MTNLRSFILYAIIAIFGAPALAAAQPHTDLLEDHATDGYVRVRARLGATLWETWRHARATGDGTVSMDDIAAANPGRMLFVCEGEVSRRASVYETCTGSRSRGFRFDTAYDIPLTAAGSAYLRSHPRPLPERRARRPAYVETLEPLAAADSANAALEAENARLEETIRALNVRLSERPPAHAIVLDEEAIEGSLAGTESASADTPWWGWLLIGVLMGGALAMFWLAFWEFGRIRRRFWSSWTDAWKKLEAEVVAARRHGIERRKQLTAKFSEWRRNLLETVEWLRNANTELAHALEIKDARIATLERNLGTDPTVLAQAPAAPDTPLVPILSSNDPDTARSGDIQMRLQTALAEGLVAKAKAEAFEDHRARIPKLIKELDRMRPREYKHLMATRQMVKQIMKEEREAGRLDRFLKDTFERMIADYDAQIAVFEAAHPNEAYATVRMELVDRIRSVTGMYADSVVQETWLEEYSLELKVLIMEAQAEREAYRVLVKNLRHIEPDLRGEDTKKIRISSPKPPAPDSQELATIRAELATLKEQVESLEELKPKVTTLERDLRESTDAVIKLTMENADLRFRSGYRPSLNPLKEPPVLRESALKWEEHDTVEIMHPSPELMSFGHSITRLADQLENRPVERIPLDPAATVDLARILAAVEVEYPDVARKGEYIPAFLLPFHLVQNHGGQLPPRKRNRTQRPPSGQA